MTNISIRSYMQVQILFCTLNRPLSLCILTTHTSALTNLRMLTIHVCAYSDKPQAPLEFVHAAVHIPPSLFC